MHMHMHMPCTWHYRVYIRFDRILISLEPATLSTVAVIPPWCSARSARVLRRYVHALPAGAAPFLARPPRPRGGEGVARERGLIT